VNERNAQISTFVTSHGIMNIAENIELLKGSVPSRVQIIAVSKTQPADSILEAYSAGHRAFGENKVQELTAKAPALPDDILWHFIGHLQTNKVKFIVPFVHMLHSVDSLKLLREIEKEAGKINRSINCLLQLHIATEETKFGLSFDEACELLDSPAFREMKHVRIRGLMGMATFTDDLAVVRKEFSGLSESFARIKARYFPLDREFRELSMGMSGDYPIAIDEGSTMVRLGTAIFGDRSYKSTST